MRFKHILSFFLIVVLLFAADDADAQRRRRNKYKRRKVRNKSISKYRGGSVGGKFRPYTFISYNVNALNYYGDLAPVNQAASTDVSWTRPGAGVNIGYKFNPYLTFRAGLNYGRITGDDNKTKAEGYDNAPRYYRNLSFRNDIKEFQVGFELSLIPNYGGPNVRKPFNAYLFAGAAIFHHEPKGLVPDFDYVTGGANSTVKAPSAGKWVRLRPLGTEGQYIDGVGVKKPYLPFSYAIPLGVGVRMRLSGPFDLGFETTYRFLFTDYIDDVSNNYVSFDNFDDPLAKIMSDRSAEPVGILTGDVRGLPVSSQTLADGQTYYTVSGEYAPGGGLANGAKRGNPKDGDTYFMTTVRLIWILGKTKKTAKFR